MGFIEAFRALSREMRLKRGLELYDISGKVRRSEGAISKWESGITRQPEPLDQWLDGYAKAFEMATVDWIALITAKMKTEADPSEIARELTEGYPERGKGRSSNAGKRGASRSRRGAR